MTEPKEARRAAAWFLEGFRGPGRGLERIPLFPLPFLIGRQAAANLSLGSTLVSARHAEIYGSDGSCWLRDLGSTNGTFVNQRRVEQAVSLTDGDILHFADQEFRLALDISTDDTVSVALPAMATLEIPMLELKRRLSGGRKELEQMLAERAVAPAFQPIVRLADGERVGYEALGRGTLPGLPGEPEALFELASAFGLDRQLSRMMRDRAIEAARDLDGLPLVFLNTHPTELADLDGLLASLAPLKAAKGRLTAVLEIHETAGTNVDAMRLLRMGLAELGVGLAYDDFGAGQEARFLHLSEAPPDYLKFHISMVRDLDRASEGRHRLLESLIASCRELGIETLAEGIERPAEAQAARAVGFELAQGFLFGAARPAGGDAPGRARSNRLRLYRDRPLAEAFAP